MPFRTIFLILSLLSVEYLIAQPIPKPEPVEQTVSEVEIIEICFCEEEARFPGGEQAMMEYFDSAMASRNLATLLDEEHKTFWVQFIVRENGTTDSFQFLKTKDPKIEPILLEIL